MDPLQLVATKNNSRKRKLEGDKRSNRKEWTTNEEQQILEYLINTKKSGREIETPSVKVYYENLIKNIKIENCDATGVNNKVRRLKESYEKAIKWRNQTGQGMEDEATIRESIIKICKHFDQLDEVYATKISIHSLYDNETTEIGTENCDMFSLFNQAENDNNEFLSEPSDKPVSFHTESKADKPAPFSTETNVHKQPLLKRVKKEPSEFSLMVQKRQETQLAEVKLNEQKLYLEKQRLDFEKEVRYAQVNLDEKKFISQESVGMAELDLKRKTLEFEKEKYLKDKEVELEKFKIEQEVRLKIEMAKLNQ